MNQSDHPHGIEGNNVPILTTLMQETNHAGHVLFFSRLICFRYFKHLGDSPPKLVKQRTMRRAKNVGPFWG